MEQPWYASISEDLEKVDNIIYDALRSDKPELQQMFDYVVTSGGKKIRPSICILMHRACGGSREDILRVASAFEVIHSATLIHDDINDRSDIRRGRRTVHKEYTVTKAVILGDLMFAIGFKLFGSADQKIIDAVVSASTAMAESELVQKKFERKSVVAECDYFDIIKGKTAMPIFICARTGAYMAGADDDITDAISSFALDIGLAFQIVDDVLDIVGDHSNTGKKIGIDIYDGKPTLPLIYAMADSVHGQEIKEIFRKDCAPDRDIEHAIELIRSTGSVERCISKAKDLVENAIPLLSCLEDSAYKDSLIGLAKYVVSRDR